MTGPSVAIVGAGMSGICMGIALKRAGFDDFTIYEKAAEVGGTWRENRYPGLTCDVPSRFYEFSFAPNPDWSHVFAPGVEIQDYVVRIVDAHRLRPHIRFGVEVAEARWRDERWQLEMADGEIACAAVLVTATGILHHPKFPPIDGRQLFEGPAFHSARWDDSVDVRGKRVAVIGAGSTGIQITSALAGVAAKVMVFQRTPQWVLPIPNAEYSALTIRVLRRFPALNRVLYRAYRSALEGLFGPAVTRPGLHRRALTVACRASLRFGLRDPALRARLTPDYPPMCKRLVLSAGFYSAVQRDDVDVITAAISHMEPRGIVTVDGDLFEADVVVYATGFEAHAYMRPMRIVGEDGATLEEAWADGPRAYRTVAVPRFPNLFTLVGPHSPIGNHSVIAVAEAQVGFVMRWLRRMYDDGILSVVPTTDATNEYYDRIKAALPNTVWMGGCQSWYLDRDGMPVLWPWTPAAHRAMLEDPVTADFRLSPES